MVAIALLAQVLLATAAFAVPTSKERFAQRAARRASGLSHQSRPKQVSTSAISAASNASHVEYSSNWAGAVLVASKVRNRSPRAQHAVGGKPLTVLSLGYLQDRDGHLHRPDAQGALRRLWLARRLCVGRHRR